MTVSGGTSTDEPPGSPIKGLFSLPPELHVHISRFFSLCSIISLAMTCRSAYRIYEPLHRQRIMRPYCQTVRNLSNNDSFLAILGSAEVNGKNKNKWVDNAGFLAKEVWFAQLKKVRDAGDGELVEDEEDEDIDEYDGAPGVGHYLGKAVLFHLFGAKRSLERKPCKDCLGHQSVKEMKQLLEKKLAESDINVHFQRPLDSREEHDLRSCKRWMWRRVCKYWMVTEKDFVECFEYSESGLKLAAPEWVRKAAEPLKALLETNDEWFDYDSLSFKYIWDFEVEPQYFLEELADELEKRRKLGKSDEMRDEWIIKIRTKLKELEGAGTGDGEVGEATVVWQPPDPSGKKRTRSNSTDNADVREGKEAKKAN